MSVPRYSDHVEEIVRVPVDQPIFLTIENPNGDVLVRGTDRSDILILAEKHGNRSSTTYQESHLKIVADDARISVHPVIPPQAPGSPKVSVDFDVNLDTDFLRDLDNVPDFVRDIIGSRRPSEGSEERRGRRGRRGRGFKVKWDNNDVAYEIEIEVPRALKYRLNIDTASGDVTVDDLTGDLSLNTASGDATLKQITGDVTHNSASGDLRLQRAAGQVNARTASGDVRIEKAALNSFSFQSASGDVQLDASLTGEGPYRIHTVSGDTRLAIAALNPGSGTERSLGITFHTMSGDARLGSEFELRGRNQWLVNAAETGPVLAVESVSGDLHGQLGASNEARSLGLRQPAPPAAPPSPAPATPPPATPSAPRLVTPPVITPPVPGMPETPPMPETPSMPEMPEIPQASATFTSNITTESSPGDPLESAAAGMPAADRLALLEAVERGEIDIEEALQRLEDRSDAEPDHDPDLDSNRPA